MTFSLIVMWLGRKFALKWLGDILLRMWIRKYIQYTLFLYIKNYTAFISLENKAKDLLSSLSERYFKLAERLQETTEVQLIWLNKSKLAL